jgi:pimeloyl-ACP methyl ester carboxylesterase
MEPSPHKSDFVNVNGIRLHYLDWGGDGPALLFLAGVNCNAHIFDGFAPLFRDRFHPLALTRRGDGESDYPETGYDIDTLTDDIRGFLDGLQIDQAILVSHSNEGIELPHFAARYPERVLKLVFLEPPYDRTSPTFKRTLENWPAIEYPVVDAVFDSIPAFLTHQREMLNANATSWSEAREEQLRHQLTLNEEGKVIYKGRESCWKAIIETRDGYNPIFDYEKITSPTLCIFPIRPKDYYVGPFMNETQQAQMVAYFENFQLPWTRQCIETFRRAIPHSKIIELENSHTYFLITQQAIVYSEMIRFLQ